MKHFKSSKSSKEYCSGTAFPFADVLEYAYSIKFESAPDYDSIRFQLKKTLLEIEIIPEVAFSWKPMHPQNKVIKYYNDSEF